MSDNADFNAAESSDTDTDSFAKILVKTTSLNAAATAGTLLGIVLAGLSADRIDKVRKNRAAKKAEAQTVSTEA